ncbi:hypothetical protein [Aquimarina sp. RZ0]|uniref:hypothetical protein n=1 Tax=Aquimarina sp. RZ0 TaxID=2607730 RepID=UPI0011F12802|nr:hypothetical protein [Aquimarina sp. RZ0]KAA1248051.1 hypothetical protein F0000_00200 [Aquimarina sp. RZ0]
MYNIDEHSEIPKDINYQNDLDFSWLRAQGQQHIEDLGRKLWTDYNIHDPGITIMELLCYAITDLGLRINQPIEDLVASPDNDEDKMHQQFKSAAKILTCEPVTQNDYRKLFIDIEGIKNTWLIPYSLTMYMEYNPNAPKIDFKPILNTIFKTTDFNAKGLYCLLVDYDKGVDEQAINKEIFKIYHKHRNLCEDLIEIKKVPQQCIRICTQIQLENGADEELVHAKIQFEIEQYFSPSLPTYTLKELLDKGWTTDQIFDGPVLTNGFITNEDLDNTNLRKEVRLSDLINIIMKIEGISLIEEISMDNCPPDKEDEPSDCVPPKTAKSDPWIICIEENHKPAICDKSTWKYKKGFLPVGIDTEKSADYLSELEAAFKSSQKKTYEDLPMPVGSFTGITQYQTMQHELPENYGVSTYGLSDKVSELRKAQAKQLQGYLLFFDQILSVYFAHLGQIKSLLSGDNNLKRFYVLKAVNDIDNIETLVSDTSIYENDPTIPLALNIDGTTLSLINDLEDFNTRRNLLLDHLLSRFAEVFEDYTSVMYKLFGKNVDDDIIKTKNNFLNQYDSSSSQRGLGFNYRLKDKNNNPDVWDTNNVSGFQKRIALLSGMSNYKRKDLFNTHLRIEEYTRPNGDIEYRWLIIDSNQTYLSSRQDFLTKQKAVDSLLTTLRYAYDPTNFRLLPTTTGTKTFVALTAPEYHADPDEKYIIGRQYNRYFTNQDNAQAEIKKVLEFIATIQSDEGFYLIENILTLPHHLENIPNNLNDCLPLCIDENCNSCGPLDPFSYQVTIVFTGWTSRFSNIDFRNYMEALIRRELPAHILPKICWIGHIEGMLDEIEGEPAPENDMENLQEYWKKFLLSKNKKNTNYMASTTATKNLWCTMSHLNTIYGSGTLHDCENEETEENKNRIILNRSTLGTL